MQTTETLLTTAEVCKILALSRETLRKMMNSTPADYGNRPWVVLGTASRPRYRWVTNGLATWAGRTSQWREEQRLVAQSGGLMSSHRSRLLS